MFKERRNEPRAYITTFASKIPGNDSGHFMTHTGCSGHFMTHTGYSGHFMTHTGYSGSLCSL